jgi:aminotransferase
MADRAILNLKIRQPKETIIKGAQVNQSYLAQRVVHLKPSGIRKFFDIVATMKDVISLGIGEPDFVTPEPIVQAGIRSLQAGETHYTSNFGILELRQRVSEHLNKLHGVSYDPLTEVIITVGVSEALYLAMTAILNPGEEVIIPTPCFVSYQAEVILAGGVPVEVPTSVQNGFQLSPKDLEAAITERTKAILIGYPSNPTGAVATRQTLMEIAEIAEKNDLVVVSDELYDQLVYGVEHVCFPGLPGMRSRTVLLGGFSKNYAMTGWRIGFAAGPADIIKGLVRVHQYTIMSAPTTAQIAALTALEDGGPHVEAMRCEYDRRRKLIVPGLNSLGLPTFEPHGAFYAFPDISITGMDDEDFAQKLLEEERVAVVPGSAFGPGGEGYVRCSYATAYEKIEEALRRMQHFMQRHG